MSVDEFSRRPEVQGEDHEKMVFHHDHHSVSRG